MPQLKALTIHNQSQISSHLLYIQEQIWTLPVNPSWRTGLSNNAQHCIWQKELVFMDQNSQNQLQVDHERSAFHLIKAGNGTFQK